MALVTAGMLPALSYLRDGRGFLAAALLIGTAGVAHGPLFALFIGVLGLVALTYAPESYRAWRGGDDDAPPRRRRAAWARCWARPSPSPPWPSSGCSAPPPTRRTRSAAST